MSEQGPVEPRERAPDPVAEGTRIGHVHLRTADLDRIKEFYVGVLGFDVTEELRGVPGWGTTGDVLFVSAGGYPGGSAPYIARQGLANTPELHMEAGEPQPDGVAGLHHVAINYPRRAALRDALRRLRAVEWPLRQVADHGTHVAIYITDPDGNDLELAWDRPFDEWPRNAEGQVERAMDDVPDLDAVLAD